MLIHYSRLLYLFQATCSKKTLTQSIMADLTLLPAELYKATVTFKEFYLFIQSKLTCSNDLKLCMICEHSYKDNIQLADCKRIYKDFFSSNVPYQVELWSLKICLELSAEPVQLLYLL